MARRRPEFPWGIKNPFLVIFPEIEGRTPQEAREIIRTTRLDTRYRQQCRRHHPDKNPQDPTAQERFVEIGMAYDFLRKPENANHVEVALALWHPLPEDEVIFVGM